MRSRATAGTSVGGWELRVHRRDAYGALVGAAGLPQPGVAIPIRLQVTDTFGASSTADTTLRIYNNEPVAAFTAVPNPSACNQSVSFDASSSAAGRPDRAIVAYEWDFDYARGPLRWTRRA